MIYAETLVQGEKPPHICFLLFFDNQKVTKGEKFVGNTSLTKRKKELGQSKF